MRILGLASGVLAAAVSGVVLVGSGCQQSGSIPPPPVPVKERAMTETPGPTTQKGVNDPETLAAKMRELVAQMEASTRPTGGEVPKVSEPPPPVAEKPNSSAKPSGVQFVEPTTQPATPPVAVTPPPTTTNPPAVTVTPPTGPGESQATPNSPSSPTIQTIPTPTLTTELDSAIKERIARDPRDVPSILDGQLLAYLKDQPTPNVAALSGLPAEDREIISAVMDALVNFKLTMKADPNAMYAAKVKPLADMSERLRTRADLNVPVMTFCSDIRFFGIYDPVPAMLSSRSDTRTYLYYEVQNFTSRFTTDTRMWETRLTQQLVLYDASGRVVWQDRVQSLVDNCRSKRNDFFVRSQLRLPPVAAGRYLLKLTLTDLNVGRVTESTLPVDCR